MHAQAHDESAMRELAKERDAARQDAQQAQQAVSSLQSELRQARDAQEAEEGRRMAEGGEAAKLRVQLRMLEESRENCERRWPY